MPAPEAKLPLQQTIEKAVSRLGGSADARDVALLAGFRAAQCDQPTATYAEAYIAYAAVCALVLGQRWAQRFGADDSLGRGLIAGAEQELASVAKTMPNMNNPDIRARIVASVAAFFDAEYEPEVARIVARGGLENQQTPFGCQPKDAPVELMPAVAGKRRRVLAVRVIGSLYAPTAELLAVPSQRFLLALDSPRDSTLDLPWKPAGWCEAPPGEAIAFRYLGRIASKQYVEAMSILL